MGVHVVAKVQQIREESPLVVTVEGIDIGICKRDGRYYAYENECAHEGGPVMEGMIIDEVERGIMTNPISPTQNHPGHKFDLVCPWHGVQYDLDTGVCTADNRMKLVPHEVTVDGDDVMVKV